MTVEFTIALFSVDQRMSNLLSAILRGYYGDPSIRVFCPLIWTLFKLQHTLNLVRQVLMFPAFNLAGLTTVHPHCSGALHCHTDVWLSLNIQLDRRKSMSLNGRFAAAYRIFLEIVTDLFFPPNLAFAGAYRYRMPLRIRQAVGKCEHQRRWTEDCPDCGRIIDDE